MVLTPLSSVLPVITGISVAIWVSILFAFHLPSGDDHILFKSIVKRLQSGFVVTAVYPITIWVMLLLSDTSGTSPVVVDGFVAIILLFIVYEMFRGLRNLQKRFHIGIGISLRIL